MVRTPSGTAIRPTDDVWPKKYAKPQFRRAHYEILAHAVRDEAKGHYDRDRPKEFQTVCEMADRLVTAFISDNPNFDSRVFLKRAGFSEGCDMNEYLSYSSGPGTPLTFDWLARQNR
jgi:hypothetical protein